MAKITLKQKAKITVTPKASSSANEHKNSNVSASNSEASTPDFWASYWYFYHKYMNFTGSD